MFDYFNYVDFIYKNVYNLDMIKTGHIKELDELAASQWGIFTSAQALSLGVSRTQINRMSASGRIESVSYGTYRFTTGEETPHIWVKAAWMSLFPKTTAYERLKRQPYDAVVVGRTAACMHGDTDFYESPYCFAVRGGKRTAREDVHLYSWNIDAIDIEVIDGIPVTAVERTIADLLRTNDDMSLVKNFINGICGRGYIINKERLEELLRPLAKKWGFKKQDGISFANELISGTAEARQINQAVDNVVQALNDSPSYQALSSAVNSAINEFKVPQISDPVFASSISDILDEIAASPIAESLYQLRAITSPIQEVLDSLEIPVCNLRDISGMNEGCRLVNAQAENNTVKENNG